MPLWRSQVKKKKKKMNKIRLFHCLSMKSPSQSGACKCIMYVTAGKVGTWPEFLWRGQITACVRRHLCCWTAREAPTAVFTLVNVLHWYFIFIFCGCMTWRMVIIIKTDSLYSLNTLHWCTATDLLITDSRKDMSTAKTTTGTSHSIRTTHNHLKVHLPSSLHSLTAADC